MFGLSRHLTAGQAPENRKYDITALTFRNVGMSGCLFTPLERNRGSGVDAADQLRFSERGRLNSQRRRGSCEGIKRPVSLKQLGNEVSPPPSCRTRQRGGALFPLSCSEAASAGNYLTHFFLEFISLSLITGRSRTHPGLMSCTSADALVS